MICPFCRREPRGYEYFNPLAPVGDPRREASRQRFCSLRHLDLWIAKVKGEIVEDLTPNEIKALEHAGDMAGEYVESLGRTDMAQFSREEWMTMIEVIVGGFSEKLGELNDKAKSA
jgi:hypothetical protein